MLKEIQNEATYPHDEDEGIMHSDNASARTVYFDESGEMHEMADEETCAHGMSAWLCAHPIYHYPTDEMMNGGQFY